MRSAAFLPLLALVSTYSALGQTPTLTPEQAVNAVTSAWLPNPLAREVTTHQPISKKGSWSVRQVAPASTNLPACKDGPVCLLVLYRVTESPASICSWAVAPPAQTGREPRVLDLNDTAASLMMRKRATVDDPQGKATYTPSPDYPPIARAAHVSGTVTVHVIISAEGKVTVEDADGPLMLEGSARDAAKRYVFEPTLINGRPIVVRSDLQLRFIEFPL